MEEYPGKFEFWIPMKVFACMGLSQSEAPDERRKKEAKKQKLPALRLQRPVVKLGGSQA